MKSLYKWTVVLVVLSSVGCFGQRQEKAQKKSAQQQRMIERLDASGRRVLFLDQHGDVLGKWRLRKDSVKVYDEQLHPQGSVRVLRDADGHFASIEATTLDGSRALITPVEPSHPRRFAVGDRFMLERQGDQWVLGQLDPFVILARITPAPDAITVHETRQDKNAIVRRLTTSKETSQVIVEDEQGHAFWTFPAHITREQALPFVLRNSPLSPLERAMCAMFFDAQKPIPQPAGEES